MNNAMRDEVTGAARELGCIPDTWLPTVRGDGPVHLVTYYIS